MRTFVIISLLSSIGLISSFSIPTDKKVSFDVITTFEGKIDPKNPPKLKIYVKANEKLYTIVSPDFNGSDGHLKFVSVMNQHLNKDGRVVYEGSAKSMLEGDGQVGTNVQSFDLERLTSKRDVYKKFSTFIYKYLNYILSTGESVDLTVLRDLYNNYIYFGALAKGRNPENEVYYKNSFGGKEKEIIYKGKAKANTVKDKNGGTLTYSVANLNNEKKENTLQHTFNINYGKGPKNVLAIKAKDNIYYDQIYSESKSKVHDIDTLKEEREGKESFASVFSDGTSNNDGLADQQSKSFRNEVEEVIAYSKGMANSIDKKKLSIESIQKKCDMDDYDGFKFISVKIDGSDMYKENIEECELLKSIYNSL